MAQFPRRLEDIDRTIFIGVDSANIRAIPGFAKTAGGMVTNSTPDPINARPTGLVPNERLQA
jgi:hypothetical protein